MYGLRVCGSSDTKLDLVGELDYSAGIIVCIPSVDYPLVILLETGKVEGNRVCKSEE